MSGRFPQVDFFIGDKSLRVPANHITSFLYKDTIAMGGDSFTLEFLDPTWEVMETDLIPSIQANSDKVVSFRFGWGGHRMSRLRYGVVTEFIPSEITRGGIRIIMKGWDKASGAENAHKKVEQTYKVKISEIVKQIAERKGWDLDVEETGDIFELEGRTGGKKPKVWQQTAKETDHMFLNRLAQAAKSATGSGGYRVYYDTDVDPARLHFHPDRAHQGPVHREYVIQTDNMGEVLSFVPQISGAATVALGSSEMFLIYRDPNTRKVYEKKVSTSEFQEGRALGDKSVVGDGTPVKKFLPSTTEGEGQARLDSYFEALSWAVNKASLEVVGDPDLKPGELISVTVKTPRGKRYFISGLYLLEEVTHNITSGNYASQCALLRNASDVGDKPLGKGTVKHGQ